MNCGGGGGGVGGDGGEEGDMGGSVGGGGKLEFTTLSDLPHFSKKISRALPCFPARGKLRDCFLILHYFNFCRSSHFA